MHKVKMRDLKEAMESVGSLTKTQLRYTQQLYALDNKTMAELFGIKPNSYNALKSYSPGSSNYTVKHLLSIKEYLGKQTAHHFKNELEQYGMVLTYSSKSWQHRIRSGVHFKTMEDFDNQLRRWMIESNALLNNVAPVVISTKELSNILYMPERDVTRNLEDGGSSNETHTK